SADYDLNIAYGDGSGLFNWTNTTGKTFGINNIQLDITGTTYTASTVSGDLISNDLLYSSVFKIAVAFVYFVSNTVVLVDKTSLVDYREMVVAYSIVNSYKVAVVDPYRAAVVDSYKVAAVVAVDPETTDQILDLLLDINKRLGLT
ncbi:hypothetical protein ACT453_23230, partial [Bacillus sp. D-CC]